MTNLVPAEQIEEIVGARRHRLNHFARAISAEQTVYILHSRQCVTHTPDLRRCLFSQALDQGIDEQEWSDDQDEPVLARIRHGRLFPGRLATSSERLGR